MSIIAKIRTALQGCPDPMAVAEGLTVQRRGRNVVYSGLPTYMKGWKRREPDALDWVIEVAYMQYREPASFTPGLPKTTVSTI